MKLETITVLIVPGINQLQIGEVYISKKKKK